MIIYVASPYVLPKLYQPKFIEYGMDEDDFIDLVRWRVRAVLEATAILQYQAATRKLPIWFYTPIGYEANLLDTIEGLNKTSVTAIRNDSAYWMELDHKIMSVANGMVVVGLPGWSISSGIQEEVDTMSQMINTDISFLNYTPKTFTSANVRRINGALVQFDNQAPVVELPIYNNTSLLIAYYRQRWYKYG